MEEKERYGITDAHYLCDSAIFNTETNDILRLYQICDLLNQQDKRIKELEKENKELEIKLEETEEERDGNYENYSICWKDNKHLKQQLAEKEKEIEVLKQRLKDTIKIYSDDFVEKDKELKELRFQARNIFPFVENLEEKINQDKISFAVEQLENCRLNLIKLLNKKLVYLDSSTADEMDDLFDNQIKLLKEGK